jgi:hypothetical protein
MRSSFPLGHKAIGLQGFEPWTSPTRTARSTKLSHNPKTAECPEGQTGILSGSGPVASSTMPFGVGLEIDSWSKAGMG